MARRARLPVHPDDCRWANAKGDLKGWPAYFRINTSLQDFAPCGGFDHEILILIHFNSAGDNGLPEDEDDLTAVDGIEDRIKDRLEADRTAVLALVITCEGARELYFYMADPKAAIQAWEDDLQPDIKTHRVRFEIRPDEDWRVYRKFA
jgi:hypothetical protein